METLLRRLGLLRRRVGISRGTLPAKMVSILAVLLVALLVSCVPVPPGIPGGPTVSGQQEGFAIYLLPGVRSAGLANLVLDSLALAEPPFLVGNDITAYTPSSHELELTQDAFRRVQDLFAAPVPVSGVPFVATVNRRPIYSGAFWTPLSSLSFDGVVIMDPMVRPNDASARRPVRIDLGYPGPDFYRGADPRNDPRILAAFEDTGKLR